MKLTNLLVSCLVISSTALAWTNEDHEIFDIVSALEVAEGKGTTFYSFLNSTQGATEKEISKSYRKRSLELHPDKNPDDKLIADRFARLGTIAAILRDSEKRKRYDHFHDNGVPKWRGTGYYYSRYRPGLGAVLSGLAIFSCFVQYLFFYLQYRVNLENLKKFQESARTGAWGPTKKPLAGRKRLQFKTGGDGPSIVPGLRDGKPRPSGTTINLVVEGDDVYVVDEGEEILINSSVVTYPTKSSVWLPKLLLTTYYRLTNQHHLIPASYNNGLGGSGSESDEESTEVVVGKDGKETTVVVRKPKGPMKGVEGSGMIAGRRRKGVPKRKEA